MVCKNALSSGAIGNEVDGILRLRDAAASVLKVVNNVMFRVEIGCDRCCAGRSSNYRYFDVSMLNLTLAE
jgi:hypothetical protein